MNNKKSIFDFKCIYCKKRIGTKAFRGAGLGTDIAAQQKFAHDRCWLKAQGPKLVPKLKEQLKGVGTCISPPTWDTVESLLYYIDDLKKKINIMRKDIL